MTKTEAVHYILTAKDGIGVKRAVEIFDWLTGFGAIDIDKETINAYFNYDINKEGGAE